MNPNFTVYVGNLASRVTEALLYELFLQVGPVKQVAIPKDRHGRRLPYGFVEFKHECSVPFSISLLNGTALFGCKIILKPKTEKSTSLQDIATTPSETAVFHEENGSSSQVTPPP